MISGTTSPQSNGQPLHDLCEDAFELRAGGLTYRQIATRQGVSPSAAYKRVRRAMERHRQQHAESREETRSLELTRLGWLEQRLIPAALRDDREAVRLVLRIIELRRRLLRDRAADEEAAGPPELQALLARFEQDSGFGIQDSGNGEQDSGFGLQDSGKCEMRNAKCEMQDQELGIEGQLSGTALAAGNSAEVGMHATAPGSAGGSTAESGMPKAEMLSTIGDHQSTNPQSESAGSRRPLAETSHSPSAIRHSPSFPQSEIRNGKRPGNNQETNGKHPVNNGETNGKQRGENGEWRMANGESTRPMDTQSTREAVSSQLSAISQTTTLPDHLTPAHQPGEYRISNSECRRSKCMQETQAPRLPGHQTTKPPASACGYSCQTPSHQTPRSPRHPGHLDHQAPEAETNPAAESFLAGLLLGQMREHAQHELPELRLGGGGHREDLVDVGGLEFVGQAHVGHHR